MNTSRYRTLLPLFQEMRGEKIIVRPYQEEDVYALHDAMQESREHLRPWLSFADAHQTIEETHDWIIHCMASWLLREGLFVCVLGYETDQHLGGCWINIRDWHLGYFEIGYWLRPSMVGHGYMTEAVQILTEYLLTSLKAERVEIRCDENNIRSALIAKRLNFTLEGTRRHAELASDGHIRNMLIFSKIAGE